MMRGFLLKAGKLLFILMMIGALYAYAMFQGGYVSWFLFYSVLILVLLNILFTLYPLRKIDVERTCQHPLLSKKETADVTLTVKKRLPFPFFFISVNDNVPNGLKRNSENPPGTVFFLAASKKLTHTYQIYGKQRGEFTLSSVELKAGDLFGFFQKERHVPLTETVIVHPAIYPLKEWNVKRFDQQGEAAVPNQPEDEMASTAGVRDYIPGDKMTSIDWKVSARTGKLVTKEFETERGQGHMLVLDTSWLENASHTFESLVDYAASYTAHCYKRNIPVGFAVLEKEVPLMKEGTERSHFHQIHQELARVSMQPTFTESSSLYKRLSSPFIICIAQALSPGLMEAVQYWVRRRQNVAIHYLKGEIISPDEQDKLDQLKGHGVKVYFIHYDSALYEGSI